MTDSEKTVRNIGATNVWSKFKDEIDSEVKLISNSSECRTLSKEEADGYCFNYKYKREVNLTYDESEE